MNKQEKLVAMLFGLLLVGWLFYSQKQAAKAAQARAAQAPAAVAEQVSQAGKEAPALAPEAVAAPALQPAAEAVPPAVPALPEEVVDLGDDDMTLAVSSHGAVLKQATLRRYTSLPGKPGEKNPPVTFDFSAEPGLELSGFPGLPPNASYRVERDPSGRAVTLSACTAQGLAVTRRFELLKDYQVKVTDTFKNASDNVVVLGTNGVSIGAMAKGASKNETLSVDSLPAAPKAKTRHWGSEKATKQYLVGYNASGFGCGGAPSAAGMPDRVTLPVLEPQTWVAVKSRFFVSTLASSEANCGFEVRAARDTAKQAYSLSSVSARVLFPGRVLGQGETLTRDYSLFIGPKKLSLLQEMNSGLDSVMEFGMFAWFCKLLVPTLNFFYKLIPNYGVAVILLTFLVRVIFWPQIGRAHV